MYIIEISNSIRKIITIYFKFGFWDNKDGTHVLRTGRKLFYFVYFLSVVVSIVTGACLSDEKDEFIFLTVSSAIGLVQICRLVYILWKKNEILTMVNQIGIHSVHHNEFIRIDNKLKTWIERLNKFFFATFITVGSFSFYPLIAKEKFLLLDMGFFVDWRHSQIAYCMAFAYLQLGICLSFVICLFTLILWYLMINLSIKYEVLEKQLRSMGIIETELQVSSAEQQNVQDLKMPQPKFSKTRQEISFLQDLFTAMKTHQQINKQTCEFASTFSILFFLQIGTSSVCICGTAYNLAFSSHKDLLEDGLYCSLIIYSLFDVFMVMYFGNEIKISSNRLSYCVFESNWIEQSELCKKYVIILAEVLKSPQELIVAKIYPLNLDTFTKIVKLAYSMFNILQNLKLRN